jgi:hypothetical protein
MKTGEPPPPRSCHDCQNWAPWAEAKSYCLLAITPEDRPHNALLCLGFELEVAA